jgi:hypothetical protein
MIGQYLPNNNETATVAFRQKFCRLNSPQAAECLQRLANKAKEFATLLPSLFTWELMHPFIDHIQLFASSMIGSSSDRSGALLIIADVILAQSDSRITLFACCQIQPAV